MTQDEIIKMARDSGFQVRNDTIRRVYSNVSRVGINEELERFAKLVAAAEREACAKVCETAEVPIDIEIWLDGTKKALSAATALGLAAVIRQRNQD